jgi:apolipoprotein N-acyltransferase
VASLCLHIILILTLCAEKYALQRHYSSQYTRVLLFPTIWTSLWFLVGRFGPLGDFISLTAVLVNWADFSQVASLGGRALLDFLMAISGTVLFELSDFPFETLSCSALLVDSTVENYEQHSMTSRKRQWISLLLHPLSIYTVIIAAVFTYGGAVVNIRSGSFYQVGYPDYIPPTKPVGCVVGASDNFPDVQSNHDIWFNSSLQLSNAGAQLIIWSETTTIVKDLAEEELFLNRTQQFAKTHNVYLGVTYILQEPIEQNKFVLADKEGKIGINYNKAHPVPLVENQPAGVSQLQFMDTKEFGRIGAGICFDFNFADFIKQASTHKVDVMLQPSWTWGPIGTYHQQGNMLRAVENGFTLFRCVSQGVSGIFEPTLNSVMTQKVASNNEENYLFYLPIQKRRDTLYGYVGDGFGWICVLGSVALLVSVYRKTQQHQLII